MVDLFSRAKEMFPTVPDEDLQRGVSVFQNSMPNATDDDLLTHAQNLVKAKTDGTLDNQIVQNELKKKYGLADYTADQRNQLVKNVDEAGSPVAAAFAGFGAGLRGGDVASGYNNALNASKADAKTQLAQFDQNRELAKDDQKIAQDQDKLRRETDPNSQESKVAQDLAISLGMSPEQAKGLTAAKFKDFSPALEQRYTIAQRSKDRELQYSAMKQNKEDAMQARKEATDDKTYDRLTSQLKDDLDPNKGRSGNMAFNQKKIDQAERLEGLMKDSKGSVSNLDSRQVEELAIGLNSMLSNSSSSAVSQVKALVPSTAIGDAMHLKEWLMNDPTGVNQTAFVKRMAETVEREKEIAGEQVKKAQVQRLSAYNALKKARPDEFNAIVSAYGIDPQKDIDGTSGQFISKRMNSSSSQGGEEGTAMASTLDDGSVTMRAPNGSLKRVPKDKIKAALAAGGQMVGE